MKKYIFVLLVLAIACAFSLSAVASVDLEKYEPAGCFVEGRNAEGEIICTMGFDESLIQDAREGNVIWLEEWQKRWGHEWEEMGQLHKWNSHFKQIQVI